jgi:NAD(P)-dependent dehydrogenase (short-subunit alcohol dehydrogenase family)
VNRTYVVTGSASGMGAATTSLLQRSGATVIGVDLHDADVVADLATPAGRQAMLDGVSNAAGDRVDGVIACAGVAGGGGSDTERIVRVNYFGALATLSGLRRQLAASDSPRAAAVASDSGVLGHLKTSWDDTLVAACLAGDEAAAVGLAGTDGPRAYASAKRALMTWARRVCTSPEWAGSGILLNTIAPGVILTPMNRYLFATPERTAEIERLRPRPLGRWGEPDDVASLLAWLTSQENRFVTGQVICIDGGYEALVRPDVF